MRGENEITLVAKVARVASFLLPATLFSRRFAPCSACAMGFERVNMSYSFN